jgi:hypothetical protein
MSARPTGALTNQTIANLTSAFGVWLTQKIELLDF